MIKKIKRYKISVRPAAVLRRVKRQSVPGWEEGGAGERLVEAEIARLGPLIVPQAVYNSYSKTELPPPLIPAWGGADKKSLSLSFVLATIGSPIEAEVEKAGSEPDPARAAAVRSVAEEALDQSLQFVLRLLNEEARSESCELSPLLPVDRALWEALFPFLESQKADIFIEPCGRAVPLYTNACSCFWNPVPKGRHGKGR